MTAYLNNRTTLNAGQNMTLNTPLSQATNINASLTMNLNLAPNVTYQFADTLTTGPGRVYSANQSYKTVGIDSITFVAGPAGVERDRCEAGWKKFAFFAATLLGMGTSIFPTAYNHFSPEDRPTLQNQAIWAYLASVVSFGFYWIYSRACDGFDMAVPEDDYRRPLSYNDETPGRFGGTLMTLNEFGFAVLGSREISADLHLTGADREGTRPVIKVGDGDVTINAEEASLPNGTQLLSRILLGIGSVFIGGGPVGTTASLDVNEIRINRQQRAIIMDNDSLRLRSNADHPINPALPNQCMVMITDNAIETFSETIQLQASGAGATFDERGAAIGSRDDYLLVADGRGVEINGKRLVFDAHTYVHWG